MIRCTLVVLLLGAALQAGAQWFYFPSPNTDNGQKAIVKQKQYKRCLQYEPADGSDSLRVSSVIYYDERGLRVSQFDMQYEDGRADTASKKYFTCDAKQRLRRTSYYDSEQEIFTVFTYNTKGQLVLQEVATIDPPRYTYKYDVRGCLASAVMTQRFPAVDTNGDPTGKTVDAPRSRMVYTCNSKQQVVSEKTFSLVEEGSQTPQSEFRWRYDAKGRIVHILRLVNTEKDKEWILSYNNEGLLIASSFSDHYSGETKKYQYRYE
jgi:hypothetical protein